MGKLKRLEIQFEHPQGVINAGETLIGQVFLHLDKPMTMKNLWIRIRGRAKVYWTDDSGEQTTHYKDEEIYLDETLVLAGSADNRSMTHPAGQHAYNFRVAIPGTCPSSFEHKHGSVRYICEATIDRRRKSDHDTKAAFRVIHILDLNSTFPTLNAPVEETETKEVPCCCVSGSISATFLINKTGFVPGENILVNAVVTNHSYMAIHNTCIAIKQYITFYSRQGSEECLTSKSYSKVVAQITTPGIKPGREKIYTDCRLQVPPILPKKLVGCPIIDISNVVKFYVNSWNSIKFANDIMIGTIPLREFVHYGPIIAQPRPLASPGAPLQEPSIDNELPPPSYEETMKGHRQISDDADSKYTRGQLGGAPPKPTCHRPPPYDATGFVGTSNQIPIIQATAGGLPPYPGSDG